MNLQQEQYSDERLLQMMNLEKEMSPTELVHNIIEDVKTFTDGEEQSDDITVMVIKYLGS